MNDALGGTHDNYRRVDPEEDLVPDVMEDILIGLRSAFIGTESTFVVLDDERFAQPLQNDKARTVVWRWTARPSAQLVGELEVDPVDIHGATIVTLDGERFQRFIDWEGALSAAGVIGRVRIPDAPQGPPIALPLS
ncbi:MAG: hypothetical protein AAFY28_17870 [Actinomycetota bacterium]